MLLGRIVQNKTYPYHQYFTAGLISLGVSLFLFARGTKKNLGESTTMSGIFLMILYLMADSFTSNWQGRLFSQYKMSSFQMMCGVNVFSTMFTLFSELSKTGLTSALQFLFTYPQFGFDLALLSTCSAVGQIFIFKIIARFGAVVFAILMTTRQALAIFLSCLIFGHVLRPIGILGVIIVFVGLALRIYISYKEKMNKSSGSSRK